MKGRATTWLTIGAYLLVSSILFYRLLGAGFVTDFLGWLACQQHTPFHLIYQCFGVQGLYFVPYTLLYGMTGLFGLNAWPWLIIFAGGHAVNAFLVARVMRHLGRLFHLRDHTWLPFVAGLLFLVHPYQVEVVAWKACINYIASCFLMLCTIWLYLKYLQTNYAGILAGSVVAYVLMLFTLEFALMLPLVLILLHICLPEPDQKGGRAPWWHAAIPFLIALLSYFLSNWLIIDKPLGHYALEATALHPFALGSALAKYTVKVAFLTRFLEYGTQTSLYGFLDKRLIGVFVIALLVMWYLNVLVSSRSLPRAVRFTSFSVGAGILLLLPVAHLYFYYLQYSENDRYTYLAMPFFSMGLVWLLWQIRYHLGKALVLAYLCCCLYFTHFMVGLWEKNHDVYTHLVSSFRWESGTIYVLNLPDNYRGTFMFRNIGNESALEEVLQLTSDRGYEMQIIEVMQYNMTSPHDGVTVERRDADTFRVALKQWGTWWWKDGVGGTSYTHERYAVKVEGQFYDVTFHDLRPDDHLVYFDGETWREVP